MAGFQNSKSLDEFLKNPFDLQKFKKSRGQSNSGGGGRKSYFFKPNSPGIYYSFFLFDCLCGYVGEKPDKNVHLEDGLTIVTFKPKGKYQDNYFDPTETLIEVVAKFNDNSLPELAFIGIDTLKIKKKLGSTFIRRDDFFIYASNQRSLVLKIAFGKVVWLKWSRLNFNLTENNIPAIILKD